VSQCKAGSENIGKFINVVISLVSNCLEAEIHAIEVVLRPPSWICPLPVGRIVFMTPNLKLNTENVGISVRISLISCFEAELRAFEVERPLPWVIPLPVWSHSLPIS